MVRLAPNREYFYPSFKMKIRPWDLPNSRPLPYTTQFCTLGCYNLLKQSLDDINYYRSCQTNTIFIHLILNKILGRVVPITSRIWTTILPGWLCDTVIIPEKQKLFQKQFPPQQRNSSFDVINATGNRSE